MTRHEAMVVALRYKQQKEVMELIDRQGYTPDQAIAELHLVLQV